MWVMLTSDYIRHRFIILCSRLPTHTAIIVTQRLGPWFPCIWVRTVSNILSMRVPEGRQARWILFLSERHVKKIGLELG